MVKYTAREVVLVPPYMQSQTQNQVKADQPTISPIRPMPE